MTKSKFMRVAAVLMAAVLLTTCAISGTFAKYVTTGGRAAETARVAKWGVTITGSTDPLFKASYETDDTDKSSTISMSVTSVNGTDKVVAPGTTGTISTLGITGSPEVAFHVAYTGTLDLGDNWVLADGTTEYCPLVITVGSEPYYIGKTAAIDSVSDLEDAVNAAFAALSADYAPNASVTATASSVTWSWPFDAAAGASYTGWTGTDANDNVLGNKTTNIPEISFAATATVTQID